MASVKNNVKIREAKASDYEDVVAIDTNVYGGFDQVPHMYDYYLQDPNRICIVLEVNGKVVGYIVSLVMDGGTCLYGQAARVSAEHRTGGLWRKMKLETIAQVFKKFNIKRFKMASFLKDLILEKIRNKTVSYDFVLTRPIIKMTLDENRRAEILDKPLKPPISNVGAADFRSILAHPDNQWKLFPHKKIMLSNEPYDIMPSNADVLIDRCSEMLCTYVNEDDHECSIVTLAQCFQTPNGLRYDVEIYTQDVDLAFAHVTKHVQLSFKYYKRGVHSIWMFLPATLPEDVLSDHLRRHFPLKEPLQKDGMSVFECEVNASSKL